MADRKYAMAANQTMSDKLADRLKKFVVEALCLNEVAFVPAQQPVILSVLDESGAVVVDKNGNDVTVAFVFVAILNPDNSVKRAFGVDLAMLLKPQDAYAEGATAVWAKSDRTGNTYPAFTGTRVCLSEWQPADVRVIEQDTFLSADRKVKVAAIALQGGKQPVWQDQTVGAPVALVTRESNHIEVIATPKGWNASAMKKAVVAVEKAKQVFLAQLH